MDTQAPKASNQVGTDQRLARSPTITATVVTTKPCPAENNTPDQRDKRGRIPALNRVSPSMVAR